MAKFNLRFTNHLSRHIAGWVPGFALVQHVGRRTGNRYETPVNVFVRQAQYVFALTYGGSDWVKDVLAAGGCVIRMRRHRIELTNPHLVHDSSRHLAPMPVRWILKLTHVEDFIVLRAAEN